MMTTVTGSFQCAWHYAKCLRALSHFLFITKRWGLVARILQVRKLRFEGGKR